MANVFPEVLPNVTSMPTQGWFCQTSGKARRRVTPNTSAVDSQAIYDVQGVPGFTHNSSAVVSVTADYTRYRDSSITVGDNVWSVGQMQFPVNMLTDSLEPENAAERYDRAIEKCVGNIALFPENCTGHISEPCRSISEIRTLVAPKARLETLTYIDEMGGWRIPVDGNDPDIENAQLDSSFPDIEVSVLPTDKIVAATLNLATAPASLFIDQRDRRFVIAEAVENTGEIGYLASGHRLYAVANAEYTAQLALRDAAQNAVTVAAGAVTAAQLQALASEQVKLDAAVRERDAADLARKWNSCITFSWDPDKRVYRSKELTIVLADVQGVLKSGANAGDAIANTHYDFTNQARLVVTFPSVETSTAQDGFCWFCTSHNEDALGFIARQHGAEAAKNMQLQVVGTQQQGPFYWVGMPAFRIPVGGAYAYPAPDILGEFAIDSTHQHNFYDKYISHTPTGLMRYNYKQQTANVLGNSAAETAQKGPHVLNFEARSQERNGGIFCPRLGGLEKHLTDKQRYLDFTSDAVTPYLGVGGAAGPTAAQIITPGIPRVVHDYQKLSVRLAAITAVRTNPVAPLGVEEEIVARQAQLSAVNNSIDSEYGSSEESRIDFLRQEQGRLRHEIDVLRENLNDVVSMEAIATNQTTDAYVAPFTFIEDSGAVSDISLFKTHFDGQEVSFAGTTSFRFPVGGTDPFQDATALGVVTTKRVYTALDEMQIRDYNFALIPATPLFFECATTLPLRLHRATMEAGNCFTLKNSRVIVDVAGVQGDTVNCAFDFTNTLSPARGVHTDGSAGKRFFAGGYSFLLQRDDNSNLNSEYVGINGHSLGFASGAAFRKYFGDRVVVSNKFSIPKEHLIYTQVAVGGVQTVDELSITHTMFATAKPVQGLIFLAPAVGNRRQMIVVQPQDMGAIIKYTPAGAHGIDETANTGTATDTSYAIVPLGSPTYVLDEGSAPGPVPVSVFTGVADGDSWEMYVLSSDFVDATNVFGGGPFVDDSAATRSRGAVFQSTKRISQHVCGPILNPNNRIGAVAPLNYDSRHLPPEMRDFRIRFSDIDWSRLQATSTTLNEIQLYQFNDGLQKVATQSNIMYLPEFRETKHTVSDRSFDVEVASELGAPSYFCVFCRFPSTDILQQPQIRSLSIFNVTTKRKSNVVTDLDISQMYHLTQRNVHPAAQYDKVAFARRQTILLKTEDIGLMGLSHNQYQKPKRVNYRFSGTTSDPGDLYVVIVYNNRGLSVEGRRLQVVTLGR